MASTAPTPPAPPPITDIDLTQFAQILDTARTDEERGLTTGLVATSLDGRPDLALKGSLMVWDKDHLAWWERAKRDTYAALASNPLVAVFVRNPVRDRRTIRFYGEARVVEDPAERQRVWDRTVQIEKDADRDQHARGHRARRPRACWSDGNPAPRRLAVSAS